MKLKELDCRKKAMDLLARREHGFNELIEKLKLREFDEDIAYSVVSKLRTEGLQSDERFAEIFTRVRVSKGIGPIKIMYELRVKGIEEKLAYKSSYKDNEEWLKLGRKVLNKKFNFSDLETKGNWLQAARFLQQRGFNSDQVKLIIKSRGS
jgi:regulatory protein